MSDDPVLRSQGAGGKNASGALGTNRLSWPLVPGDPAFRGTIGMSLRDSNASAINQPYFNGYAPFPVNVESRVPVKD